MKKNYKNPYGTWKVTTEGDCEGKSTTQLGVFTGFVDEIALYLADQCYYSLTFYLEELITKFVPTQKSVNMKFDIDSKTWHMTGDERVKFFEDVFKDRPNIVVKEGNYYASVTIETLDNVETKADLKRKGLAKLTDKEKEALGL